MTATWTEIQRPYGISVDIKTFHVCMLQRKHPGSEGCQLLTEHDRAELIKGLPDVVWPLCSCLKGWGEGGAVSMLCYIWFTLKGLPTHIRTRICPDQKANLDWTCMGAHKVVRTLMNKYAPTHSSEQTNAPWFITLLSKPYTRAGAKLCKTDNVHFPVVLPERPARPERW